MVAYYAKYVVNATGMLMTNYGHNRVEIMFAIRNTLERGCTKVKLGIYAIIIDRVKCIFCSNQL